MYFSDGLIRIRQKPAKLTKDITDIVLTEITSINEKISGLNFLELLKINVVEKLSQVISEQKFPLKQIINYEKEINENSRNIKISINYFLNSLYVNKKNIDYDSLFLIFNENSNLDIYKDEKNFTSILLYKNTGISLPRDTIINSKFKKNVLLMEIINKNIEEILTN